MLNLKIFLPLCNEVCSINLHDKQQKSIFLFKITLLLFFKIFIMMVNFALIFAFAWTKSTAIYCYANFSGENIIQYFLNSFVWQLAMNGTFAALYGLCQFGSISFHFMAIYFPFTRSIETIYSRPSRWPFVFGMPLKLPRLDFYDQSFGSFWFFSLYLVTFSNFSDFRFSFLFSLILCIIFKVRNISDYSTLMLR